MQKSKSFRAAQPARRNQAVPPRPRLRTHKVSEKLKALRRIVPCDPKADIATMLDQACKYVRYLEAQVGGTSEIERRMIESVGRLSRKEVVEAVVNSGTAQNVMYEEELCLLSEEQVRVLAWSAFQKQQQLSGLIGGAANNNNSSSTSSCCYSYSSCSYSYS